MISRFTFEGHTIHNHRADEYKQSGYKLEVFFIYCGHYTTNCQLLQVNIMSQWQLLYKSYPTMLHHIYDSL